MKDLDLTDKIVYSIFIIVGLLFLHSTLKSLFWIWGMF